MGEKPKCNNPECQDGYVFEPPLQDGALGVMVKCSECAALWQRYWSNHNG